MLSSTLAALARDIQAHLEGAGIDTAALEARMIVEQRTGNDWSDCIAKPDTPVEAEDLERIERDLDRRLAGEPLSRIYGVREFWGLEFELSPDTLDPRPDTELIVELVLKHFAGKAPPENILDLGTGTGCILISLLREFPDARGVGVDLSSGALEMAQRNAVKNRIEAPRISFLCGSWFEPIEEHFDLIVSNPPYIPNPDIANLGIEVKNHDPILALDGGKDGMQAYMQIFGDLKKHLSPCGKGYFEIGFDQEKNAVRLAEESGLRVVDVHRDLAGLPRVVEISSGDK